MLGSVNKGKTNTAFFLISAHWSTLLKVFVCITVLQSVWTNKWIRFALCTWHDRWSETWVLLGPGQASIVEVTVGH